MIDVVLLYKGEKLASGRLAETPPVGAFMSISRSVVKVGPSLWDVAEDGSVVVRILVDVVSKDDVAKMMQEFGRR